MSVSKDSWPFVPVEEMVCEDLSDICSFVLLCLIWLLWKEILEDAYTSKNHLESLLI